MGLYLNKKQQTVLSMKESIIAISLSLFLCGFALIPWIDYIPGIIMAIAVITGIIGLIKI